MRLLLDVLFVTGGVIQLTFIPAFCMAYVLLVNEFSLATCPHTSNVLLESSLIICQNLVIIITNPVDCFGNSAKLMLKEIAWTGILFNSFVRRLSTGHVNPCTPNCQLVWSTVCPNDGYLPNIHYSETNHMNFGLFLTVVRLNLRARIKTQQRNKASKLTETAHTALHKNPIIQKSLFTPF